MLTFYYNAISPNARRVWITLLEKKIPFEPVILKLDGDQMKLEFLNINPFHHIPVIVDQGFKVVESLAILDYLEAKYPDPPLLPTEPEGLGIVRMVQLLTDHKLMSAIATLIAESKDSKAFQTIEQSVETTLEFFVTLLDDRPYFGSYDLTLGDIVAGTAIALLPELGLPLDPYPTLQAWLDRLIDRPVWQETQLNADDLEFFKRRVKVLVKLSQRQMIRTV
jgi:glutathione S-transferase